MFRFTIRDVLWLTVVVALAVGWWIDQDRIRRHRGALKASEQALANEREKFQIEAQRLQTLPLRVAEAMLDVEEAELASIVEVNRRNPGAIFESELRRYEARLEAARLEVEKARTREELGPATKPSQGPMLIPVKNRSVGDEAGKSPG